MLDELPLGDRGVLFPDRLPDGFVRLPAAGPAADLVAWWWCSRWDLAPGEVSRQHVISFPASNLVVEPAGITLWGPTTRATRRDLEDSGWAFAALLRPAGLSSFRPGPGELRDAHLDVEAPRLHAAITDAISHADLPAAAARLGDWLVERTGPVEDEAHLANRLVAAATTDATLITVTDLARHLHVSERTIHRLAERHVGLTPNAIIRRRRVQEAARQVRDEPGTSLGAIAVAHGFTDQAHLSREFRQLLGRSPRGYREEAAAG